MSELKDRRWFFRSLSIGALSSVAVLNQIVFVAEAEAADIKAGEQQPRLMVNESNMHRLPDLPGRVLQAGLSSDGQVVAVVFAYGKRPGASLCTVETEAARKYRQLIELPDALQVYSVAWADDGKRIALSVWEHIQGDGKPYQTSIYLVDSLSGKVESRDVMWSESNPLDKSGVRLLIAWSGDGALLASREGSSRLYKIDLADPSLRVAYQPNGEQAEKVTGLAQPVPLGDGLVGVVFYKSLERQLVVFGPGGSRVEAPSGMTGYPKAHGADSVLFCKAGYYRGYRRQHETRSWSGEFVRWENENAVVARVPLGSAFKNVEAERTMQVARSLSLDGSHLLIHEIDLWANPKLSVRKDHPEPYGRFVVVDLTQYILSNNK